MKRVIKAAVFAVLGLAMFVVVQGIFTPNWASVDANNVMNGFEALNDNSIDYLVLGSSLTEQAVSPMKIYDDTGIKGYNLSTAGQPIECSYFMAKKAFLTQKPLVVMVEASNLLAKDTDNYNIGWRYILDNLPISDLKLSMAKEYGNMWFSDGYWSAICPMVLYHSRWNELTAADFNKKDTGWYFSAGMYLDNNTVGTNKTLAQVLEIESGMKQRESGRTLIYDKTTGSEKIVEEETDYKEYDPQLNQRKCDYLIKLKELCEDNNAELVLIKVPRATLPQESPGAWTRACYELTSKFSKENNITYYDFSFDYTDVVDFHTDTRDGGLHVNIRGAEKITDVLENILMEKYACSRNKDEIFDCMLDSYKKIRSIAILESETNFHGYIDLICEDLDNKAVFIVGSDEFTRNLTSDDYAQLQELGLRLADDANYADAYMAVIDNGEIIYEATSNKRITHSLTLSNGCPAEMLASGWYNTPLASIKLGGIEHARNGRGLNIVVFDYETGLVIDSVSFNTFEEGQPANRDIRQSSSYFIAYKNKILGKKYVA